MSTVADAETEGTMLVSAVMVPSVTVVIAAFVIAVEFRDRRAWRAAGCPSRRG